MQYLYLQFLYLRVWFLRRRLRRMGFPAIANQTIARTLLYLPKAYFEQEKLILDWIKVGLAAIAILSMWLIFGLRTLEPIQIVVPLPENSSRPNRDTSAERAPQIHQEPSPRSAA